MLIVLVGVGWLIIIGFPHVTAGVEPLLFQRRDLIFQGGVLGLWFVLLDPDEAARRVLRFGFHQCGDSSM